MATAAFILAPRGTLPDRKKDEEKMAAIRWEHRLLRLTSYRSGYREIKACKKGGVIGYVQNRGEVDAFNFGEFDDELTRLLSLAHSYPGEYLAIWTFGQAVHTLFICPGAAVEQKEVSFRLVPPAGATRPGALFDDFCAWFKGSAFSPDFKALKSLYMGPEISVTGWFKAFGIDGAAELKRADGAALWNDFEEVALRLLRHEDVPPAGVKRLNAILSQSEGRPPLKAKPLPQPGVTARLLAGLEYDLAEALGQPEEPLWKERKRAAGLYWDITDCDACDRLTTGLPGKKGLGESASFGRLLCHYPVAMRRDNLFLALGGLQAEGANGHAFVPAFFSFAEISHQAGFTLAVYPPGLREGFRKAFEIEGECDVPPDNQAWSADLFLPLPGILKKVDPREELKKWFAKEKAEGLVLSAAHNGSFEIVPFTGAIAVKDEQLLRDSIRELNVAGLFTALGLPDLLKPGEWQEGTYSGENLKAGKGEKRARAKEALASLPGPSQVPAFKKLLDTFPRTIRHRKNSSGSGSSIPAVLRLLVPVNDETHLRSLMGDFRLRGMVAGYGDTWIEDGVLWAYTGTDFTTAMMLRLLGCELPASTSLAIDVGGEKPYHYELAGDDPGPEHHFRSCLVDWNSPDEKEMKERSLPAFYMGIQPDSELFTDVAFEAEDRLYFRADITGWTGKSDREALILTQALQQAGLTLLGDLVCSQFSNIILRGFAADETYCILMMPVRGGWFLEYVTYFDDDTTLTTTTNPDAGLRPQPGLIYQKIDAKAYAEKLHELPAEMLRQHRARIGEVKGSAAKSLEPTLTALARQQEVSLKRQPYR
jgi:hypothetical protein